MMAVKALRMIHPVLPVLRRVHNVRNRYNKFLKTAILDWSGTTADKYVIAPARVFFDVFAKHNVPITMEEARLPMGLRKDLHIGQILMIPEVRERWTNIKGCEPTQEDVDILFRDFVPMQIECLPQYSGLLPETLAIVNMLKKIFILRLDQPLVLQELWWMFFLKTQTIKDSFLTLQSQVMK